MIISFLPQLELNNEMNGQTPSADTGAEAGSFIDALLSSLAVQAPAANPEAAGTMANDENASKGSHREITEAEAALTDAVLKDGESAQALSPASGTMDQGMALAVGRLFITQAGMSTEVNEAAAEGRSAFTQVRGLANGHAVAVEAGAGLKTGLLAQAETMDQEPAADIDGDGPEEIAAERPAANVDRHIARIAEGNRKTMEERPVAANGDSGGPEEIAAGRPAGVQARVDVAAAKVEGFDIPEADAAPVEAEIETLAGKPVAKEAVNNEPPEIKTDTGSARAMKAERPEHASPAPADAEVPETDEAKPEMNEGNAFEAEAVEEWTSSAGQESGFSGNDSSGNAPHQHRPVAIVTGAKFSDVIDVQSSSHPVQTKETIVELQQKLNAGINISVQKNGGEVRMKLNPDNLGELVIKLTIENGSVKADIRAESIEIKHLIEADSSMLKEALGAHGLSLKECTIGVNRAEQSLSNNEDRWTREHSNNGSRENGREQSGWQGRNEGRGNYHRQDKTGNIDVFA